MLIGGLNGGGKTTFLDALQLCLFGPHAKISNRGTLSYQEYLSRSIHRGTSASEAAIEVSFRYTVEGREEQYRVHRSWHRNGKGCTENLEVRKNGVLEPALADNWASQVEEFFPANIAHLFLFDGEQAEAYAAQDDSSALIGAAIQNLLGLDMVDRLQKDLAVYERRKRSEDKADPRNADISATQEAVHDLRAQYRRAGSGASRAADAPHRPLSAGVARERRCLSKGGRGTLRSERKRSSESGSMRWKRFEMESGRYAISPAGRCR